VKQNTQKELRQLARQLNGLKLALQTLNANSTPESHDMICELQRDVEEMAASQETLVARLGEWAEDSPDATEQLIELIERKGTQVKADCERLLSAMR
jgi:hypothetical protein